MTPFHPKKILILGASSAIAQAAARLWAAQGAKLCLAGRSQGKLDEVARDLRVRGAVDVFTCVGDFASMEFFSRSIAEADKKMQGIDLCLVAWGSLADQIQAQTDPQLAKSILDTNFVNVALCLGLVANYFEQKRSGSIAVISSVAGERGRQSNYIYGSAKAGLTAFLQGLRNRMFHVGVNVLTIAPGFVDTPMTAGIDNKSFLYAKPDAVGRGIVRAVKQGGDKVFLPWFWSGIMLIIRSIPERLFKRMKM